MAHQRKMPKQALQAIEVHEGWINLTNFVEDCFNICVNLVLILKNSIAFCKEL